jgi:hypothetical protein
VPPKGVGNHVQQAYNELRPPERLSMTIQEQVLEKLRDLPPEKQKEVLDFVEFLKEKNGAKKPLRSLLGLWADLNFHVTEEDIAEARREMWGNFPRDIEL